MKFIALLILSILLNAAGLALAAHFIFGFHLMGIANADGFSKPGSVQEILVVALILTALNMILKPIVKLFLGPIIILTLGLGLILVNSFMLFLLTLLSNNLRIEGISAFLWGSLILGVLNFIAHLIV